MSALSVVVRTCDRPAMLGRALACIAGQTRRPDDVVVINEGGPMEPVREIVKAARQDLKIVLLEHEQPLGRGGALNAGIRTATSDWLAFLDDDDTWDPEFISAVSAVIKSKSQSSETLFGVVTQTNTVWECPEGLGWREHSVAPFNPRLISVQLRELVLANRFTNNAFVFPKAAHAIVGPFREDLSVLEDWEFNVRFASKFPIQVIPRPLARYHQRKPGGQSSTQNTALLLHHRVRADLRESWLRNDISSGRFGLGALSLLAEIEANRGLRLFNRLASWFGH